MANILFKSSIKIIELSVKKVLSLYLSSFISLEKSSSEYKRKNKNNKDLTTDKFYWQLYILIIALFLYFCI